MPHLRVGVICDYAEESWFSMDLVGEMLCAELDARHSAALKVTRIRPAFVRRFSHPGGGGRAMRVRFNADRALNRFFDYPRMLRRLRGDFDVFHVVDHSYAHLALELDGSRTIVACHDLDAFRCLLPEQSRRSVPLRMMARRSLAGMRRAARVCCSTNVTREALAASGLVHADRIVLLPYGVHPAFSPRPNRAADDEITRMLGPGDPDAIEILHVGSTILRKRIDVLLRIIAAVRISFPKLRLVKAGGTLTAEQTSLAGELGIRDSIVALPFLEPTMLAALYRRAAIVLITSESEGFGLPLVEAMACGTPVISSDIPELREAGGPAASYCPVGGVSAWSAALCAMLNERAATPAAWTGRCTEAIRQGSRFSWAAYADACALLYRELANQQ